MKVRIPRRSTKLALALLCALAIAPTPSTAWSFSSLFGGDDDDKSSAGPGPSTQAETNAPATKESKPDGISADHSDGTDMNVTQPLLKATDWFIMEEEIVASHGGVPRDGLQTYTTGNTVTVYTVANEYFTAVVKDFRATKEGDRRQDGLRRHVQGHRGAWWKRQPLVVVQLLLTSQNTNARDAVNKIPPSPINGAKAVYLFDNRVPLVASSHHQKAIVIASNKSTGKDQHPIAYVGGIDLTNDRWDTYHLPQQHSYPRTCQHPISQQGMGGRTLSNSRTSGEGVANNFLQRWNSDYKPCQGLGDDLLDFDNPGYEKLPPINYASSNTSSKLGKQNIQIVRTFSCIYKYYKEFAPRGEQSLFRARLKALRNAKNFIYIEDQYFIYVPELLDALMEVLPRIQRLIVVLQPPDVLLKASGYGKYIYEMINPMKTKFPNKVQIYTTKADLDIYVHTKLVLIDDVYVSLGSANWNRRSMKSDSELNANVIDDKTVESPDSVTVLKLARDMRIRKFVEMTRLSYDKLNAMKFIDAAGQFKVAAKDESTILTDFGVKYSVYYTTFIDTFREQVDPQEVCSFSGSGSTRELE